MTEIAEHPMDPEEALRMVGLGERRRYESGIQRGNALDAEIKSGLQEGEQVVLHPSNDIKDGVPLKPCSN